MAKKEIKKRPAHRPSLYDEKYIDEMLEYFSIEPYEISPTGKRQATDIPTFAGFCSKIGIHRETLLNWTEVHEKFFDAYKKCKDLQEQWLAVNGNAGLINPAFAIFTAKNILNWRDKKEIEVSGSVKDLSDEELDKRLAERLESKK